MATVALEPSDSFLASAGVESAVERGRGCVKPVRLRGAKHLVNTATGELTKVYSSADELDGYTYVKCGNRRAAVCPTCSHEYKGDSWHLFWCGLAGGKGVPESVADHPCTFATLTAPSFGPVDGVRQKGPCRGRRDKPLCPHGRPLWCGKRHTDTDPRLGEPLCRDCYDYTAHVVWQWYVPELWRRFCIGLQRELAKHCGLSVKAFRQRCMIAYAKVVEFQVRGAVHVHAPIRLDGPDGADGPPPDLPISTADLEDAIHRAAAHVSLDTDPLKDGTIHRLHWGSQVDTRSITDTADRDGSRTTRVAHPRQVAAYLAKYLTKTTEDFGLPPGSSPPPTRGQAEPPSTRSGSSAPPRTSPRRGSPTRGSSRTTPPSATAATRSPSPAATRSPSVTSAAPAGCSRAVTPALLRTPTSAWSSTSTTTSPKASRSSPPSPTPAPATSTSTRPRQRSGPPPSLGPDDDGRHRSPNPLSGGARSMKEQEYVIPPVVYRVEEAAEALRLTRDAIYELIRSGQLRSFKVGRRRLVPIDALTEFVASMSGDAA